MYLSIRLIFDERDQDLPFESQGFQDIKLILQVDQRVGNGDAHGALAESFCSCASVRMIESERRDI